MRDGMPVHRESDEQSEGDRSNGGAMSEKPRLVAHADGLAVDASSAQTSGKDDAAPDTAGEAAGHDSGKTHMIGDALKSVYQRTLEEDIPDDFLDLLKQLK